MNSPNKRYQYELATPPDGPEMLEILEETDFKGLISLAYTRRPDPYCSYVAEGPTTRVMICRDLHQGRIAGMGAYTTRRLYVNGVPTEVGYLFGLRVRQAYRKTALLLPQGYRMLHGLIQGSSVQYHLTTILEENRDAQRLLEKRRSFMPGYLPLTRYGTLIFSTRGKNAGASGEYRLKQATSQDIPAILQFLQTQGQGLQFFPVLDQASFAGVFPGLELSDFHLLLDRRQNLVACGALWNQNSYKQYLVKGYGNLLKVAYPFSGALKQLGFPRLPKPGATLNFATLSFWAVRDHEPAIFRQFLQNLSATRLDTDFLVVGMSESHPLMPIARRMSRISYWSKAYRVDWENEAAKAKLDARLPLYLECGLL